MPELISYETIRAAARAEKEDALQKLPPDFFSAVRSWLAAKAERRDTTSLLEVENARRLIEEIVSRRERKIVLAALRTIRGEAPLTGMTEHEQKFFDHTVSLLKEFRSTTTEQLLGAAAMAEEKIEAAKRQLEEAKQGIQEVRQSMPQEPKPTGKSMLLKITTDVPRFVGSDITYGPLKAGDMITLPPELGRLLLERGAAEIVLG